MLKEELKIVGFAAVVCVVCSLALSATHISLKEKQLANAENDRKLNVLRAFGVDTAPGGKKIGPEEIAGYFTDHLSYKFLDRETNEPIDGMTFEEFKVVQKADEDGAPLPLYIWKDDGEATAYGFPMSGMGLWSTVYSYVSIEKDLETIKGVTFYGHGETPGLGGECSKPWFMNNFQEKKLYADGNPTAFEVVKGKAVDKYGDKPQQLAHAVDGMSGATITGNGIQKFIREYSELYDPYFDTLRN
jgi:Na+-transporting NADH:ubiquinone oxidoreductase subunit C